MFHRVALKRDAGRTDIQKAVNDDDDNDTEPKFSSSWDREEGR